MTSAWYTFPVADALQGKFYFGSLLYYAILYMQLCKQSVQPAKEDLPSDSPATLISTASSLRIIFSYILIFSEVYVNLLIT